jgi:DNA helicase-2/ATP-dependent DNA helicase PcrA
VSLLSRVRSRGKQELMGSESRPTDEIDLEDKPGGPGISWTGLAGPAALGRSVLLAPGVDAPTPWENCERISLNDVSIVSPTTLRVVRRTFLTRSPVVYEIDPMMQEPSGGTDQREVWDVEPNTDLVAEATWRLACSNAVDARDVSHPTWPLAAMAMKFGASPATGRDADVILPDGTFVWCDGGPLQLWEAGDHRLGGAAVVPRAALIRGLLTPVVATSPAAALAPDQLLAVADPSTRARIIAPAGSGKTRVLTERARHVLDSGVPVDSLLLVAFNKRAQQEMRERTSDHPRLQIQTLNALALSVLNGTNGFVSRGTRLQTINERDVRAILSDSEYVKYPRKTNTDPAAAWIDALTEVRLGLRSPQSVEDAYRGDLEGFAAFFPHYRQYLAEHNQVDFDEQIYLAIEVLLRDPRVRLAAEQRAEVLLVDEYQDLTPAHMLLLRLLAGPSLSIFGVGDDDQTIYGFSGATPEWLVHFGDHVPEAVHHALEINYRCPAPVITAAFNLLSRNALRVPKEIRPGPNNVRSADSFAVAKVDDQLQHVTNHVRLLLDAGTTPPEIAVLSRVNALLVPVQVALLEAGVPVNLRDGSDFLKSSGVESALAWLRLALRPERMAGADIMLAVRRPGRGISPRARGWMGEQATVEGLTRLAGRMDESTSKKITEFVHDLERLTRFAERATTSELIEFIRTEIGLDRALATLDASHQGRNSASNSDGLRSLIALGRLHAEPKTFDAWLKRLLNTPPDENGVVIATVHKVKGLEWPHVIVYDASSTIFPHRLSTDIEEERRVFHVAITRCTTSLVITADAESPSIFLNELSAPADLPRSIRDEEAESILSQGPVANDPVAAEVGLRFTWGGYDCVVRAVDISGALVSAGGTRITVPFGSRVHVNGRSRSLSLQSSTKARRAPGPISEANAGLYNILKAWRLEQARADKVPAYVVFTDRTLEELSSVRPGTVGELLAVSGIGPAKVDRYGDQILAIIEQTEGG